LYDAKRFNLLKTHVHKKKRKIRLCAHIYNVSKSKNHFQCALYHGKMSIFYFFIDTTESFYNFNQYSPISSTPENLNIMETLECCMENVNFWKESITSTVAEPQLRIETFDLTKENPIHHSMLDGIFSNEHVTTCMSKLYYVLISVINFGLQPEQYFLEINGVETKKFQLSDLQSNIGIENYIVKMVHFDKNTPFMNNPLYVNLKKNN